MNSSLSGVSQRENLSDYLGGLAISRRDRFLLVNSLVDDVLRDWHKLNLLNDVVNLLVREWQVSGQLLSCNVKKGIQEGFAYGFVPHCALVQMWLEKFLEDKVAWVLEHALLKLP